MNRDVPHIGIFDSGVGGLSVWKEILKLLPGACFSYVSDNAFCPYGLHSADYIIDRAERITNFLLVKGVSVIVVACNTATAAAIDILREKFDMPFIGMEPAIKPAAVNSSSGVVGVLATAGTFNGRLYKDTLKKYASDTEVIERVGSGLVELVESGELEGEKVEALLRKYIEPMLAEKVDHIVLGCTHYPFLSKEIARIAGQDVVIINPAPAVAKHLKDIIVERFGNNNPVLGEIVENTTFYSTASGSVLKKLAGNILPDISPEKFCVVNI